VPIAYEQISLVNCSKLTHQGLRNLYPGVKSVNLSMCSGLSDKALKCLCEFPVIEQLNLSYCIKITDSGVQLILSKLKNLKQLNLYNCNKLSPLFVEKISVDPMKIQVDLYNAYVLPLHTPSYLKKILATKLTTNPLTKQE